MARRRKLKKISLAQPSINDAPLDLRPNTILNPQEKVIGLEADNPNNPVEKIIVWHSARDPLIWMYAQGTIDNPQRKAGERWRECVQLCEIGPLRGQDFMREYVDTSSAIQYEPCGDRQIRAAEDLSRAKSAVVTKHGSMGLEITNKILINNEFPRNIARDIGRKIDFIADLFKEALQTISISFTYRS